MSAPTNQWQLFSPAESVEDAIFQIFTAQGIPAQKRFESRTNTTPRVDLQFILGKPIHRHIINANNANAQAQPFDAWEYIFLTMVVTERTQNGIYHVEWIQKARYNLQYFRLLQTFTTAVAPYHSISSIEEVSQQDTVDDEKNCQMSQLTFKGILNIREDAWS